MTGRNAFNLWGDVAKAGDDKPHSAFGSRHKILHGALTKSPLRIGMPHITHGRHDVAVFNLNISYGDRLEKRIGCIHLLASY